MCYTGIMQKVVAKKLKPPVSLVVGEVGPLLDVSDLVQPGAVSASGDFSGGGLEVETSLDGEQWMPHGVISGPGTYPLMRVGVYARARLVMPPSGPMSVSLVIGGVTDDGCCCTKKCC